MPILDELQYECDFCHGIFNLVRDETWNEDKANDEYKHLFPSSPLYDRDVVCDDCWKMVRPDAKSSR